MSLRRCLLAASALALALGGCDGMPAPADGGLPDGFVPPPMDGGDPDGGAADGGQTDGGGGGTDGGSTDGGMDGSVEPGRLFPAPRVTTCPGDTLPPPATGRCDVTPGSSAILLTGDVLRPGEVLRGGQVLVGTDGLIACVGCDCSSAAGADAATRVVCPDVAISPGLINAHDHVTFAGAWPYGDTRPGRTDRMTEERYQHRHDWRRGLDGHTRVPASGAMSNTGQMQWLELRQMISGTTSIFGSGGPAGFLRNLDSNTRNELPRRGATYQTFPLGDGSSGLKLTMGCAYPGCSGADCFDPAAEEAFVPHVAEGIDTAARNEFLCLSMGAGDVTEPQSAFIHGVGLLPIDIAEMAAEEVELIWSPRTNITLYGDTARITEYARLGVSIGLGTDWVATGSMNMLRELACADALNQSFLSRFFPDEQLWLMATRNSARALRVDDVLGTIEVGYAADLALFDASVHRDYRAVLMARPEDVVLVMIEGRVRFGDAGVVNSITTGCDVIADVCGEPKRVCVANEQCLPGCTSASGPAVPCTYELLRGCGEAHPTNPQYPLFFCEEPADEPSCLPARTHVGGMFPNAMVNGSNYYAGMSTVEDVDGDGIPNESDNCPDLFNPIRPLDEGAQADYDRDGLGDACDPCPLGGDADPATCNGRAAADTDGDGVPNESDNCPALPNPLQEDGDGDGIGDACDACPTLSTPIGSQNVYSARCGGIAVGESVTVRDLVVTSRASNGFFAQQQTGSADHRGVDFSGIFVFTSSAPTAAPGDVVTVSGTLADFFGLAQLTRPTVTVTASGVTTAPLVVEPMQVGTGRPRAEALESVLVRVETVTVTNPDLGFGEFEVDEALRIDDALFRIDPPPSLGETFDWFQGPLTFSFSNSKILPRDAADVGRSL